MQGYMPGVQALDLVPTSLIGMLAPFAALCVCGVPDRLNVVSLQSAGPMCCVCFWDCALSVPDSVCSAAPRV